MLESLLANSVTNYLFYFVFQVLLDVDCLFHLGKSSWHGPHQIIKQTKVETKN